jgi:hypothetical protein
VHHPVIGSSIADARLISLAIDSMFITYTESPLNMKKLNRYNGVTSFASVYGRVRLTSQLPDGKTETIILQEGVHLPGSFNLISQSQIMHNDIKVEPVNQYSLNLYNRHGKLIATAPQVNGLCNLDPVRIKLRNRPNTPISTTTTAACWHLK